MEIGSTFRRGFGWRIEMSTSYCEICGRDFGDPDYQGCGPTVDEWLKHYEHLLEGK